jgi:hypothetical protein
MLFMIIEHFKERNPKPIYQRFQKSGRALPEGLRYIDSWIEVNFNRCFQLMECGDASLLQHWILQWRDLVDFEVVPVCPSRAVQALLASHADSPAKS